MQAMAEENAAEKQPPEALRCDFCGEETPQVRRIALDRGYDRLQPHPAQYACEACSKRKELERLGEHRP